MPKTTEGRLTVIVVVLAGLLIWAGSRIVVLQGIIAARPMVQDRVVTRTIQGPTRVEVRTIIKPGGEKIVERIRVVESRVVDREVEHQETPACPPPNRPKTRYAGLGVDPLAYAAPPRLRAGVTLWGVIDVGLAYDPRFSPRNGAFGVEAAYRF